jgi:hypothetical protein
VASCTGGVVCGQAHGEPRADADDALDIDASTVGTDDLG